MVYLIEHHYGKGKINSFASLLGCHERRQDAYKIPSQFAEKLAFSLREW